MSHESEVDVGRRPIRVDVITLFPETCAGSLGGSIVGRALERGLAEVRLHSLREHGEGRHATVDDAPFGGGAGMVLKPAPLFSAIETVTGAPAGSRAPGRSVVLLTPSGERLDQSRVRRWAGLEQLVLVCGRYEGVDERVREHACDEAVSIGDFVLSGGELAAAAIIDAVVRLQPGALGNEASAGTESFEDGLLEGPQYTRPAEYRGLGVPDVLLSGDHGAIRRYRRRASLAVTRRVRPDLLAEAESAGRLHAEDRALLGELRESGPTHDTPIPAAAEGRRQA